MKTKQNLIKTAVLLATSTLYTSVYATLPLYDAALNFVDSSVERTCLAYPDANEPSGCAFDAYEDTIIGSYFAMDMSGNGAFENSERNGLSQGSAPRGGFKLRTTQPASGTHSGAPDGTETTGIDAAWNFFSNTGLHLTTSNSSVLSDDGAGNVTVDMSGWAVSWNGISVIPMGSGPSNGVGTVTCTNTCEIGDTYTLDYLATVPPGDPSGFGNVNYQLHLEGTVGSFNNPPVTTDLNTEVTSASAIPAGTSVILDLTLNVTDSDTNDGLSETNLVASTLAVTPFSPPSDFSACTPSNLQNNGDGTITFPACPDGIYKFNYSFSDGLETSNISTVTVTASGNPIPNAVPDSATVEGTTATEIDVLANDTDNDIDEASVAIVTDAINGSTSVNPTTGAITYTANIGFAGTDTLTYTVSDDSAQTSAPATVTITINAFNTPASSSTFSVGTTALATGSMDGVITIEGIGIIDDNTNPEDKILQSCIGGCFDFELSGLNNGDVGNIILPLSTPIPTKVDPGNSITYRKLINGVWKTFDRSGGDTFQSAPGTVTADGVSCPTETSSDYRGLTAGDSCLLLSITDGGPNDDDELANGTVVDPGGLAEITRVTGTDGCSMGGNAKPRNHVEWLLVASFIALLGWFKMSRRKA